MAKKKNSMAAFDDAFNNLGLGNAEEGESIVNLDNDIFEPDDVTKIPGDDDTIINPDAQTTEPSEDDDNKRTQIDNNDVQDDLNNDNDADQNRQTTNINNDDPDDADDTQGNETEAANVGAFFDAFAEQLGWEVDDEEKPKSVEDLIGYIEDVVEENSKPQYADDRIAQLDEYVKNGGNFEDFYNRMSQSIEYDNLDIEDENNQKLAVRDYLKLSGYTDEQINRKIERYEDADMLADEAEDALERLKLYQKQQVEEQQAAQERARQEQQEQAQQFVTNLNTTIGNLKSIRGVAIPKEDRKLLFDYITKVDANGLTQYQKDFNKNMVNNLIESAYFTMKGDALIGEATRNGQTTAANKLRQMLRHTTKNHSTYNIDDKQRSVADIASAWYH